MPFRVIEQALKAWLDRQLQKHCSPSVENINASYALTCIIDCITWILKIGVGGQVHIDIYGECVVRQVRIIIVKTTVATPKRRYTSNRRCFSLFKIN
jgi:hypothetical protein